jgi:hypothetical protein
MKVPGQELLLLLTNQKCLEKISAVSRGFFKKKKHHNHRDELNHSFSYTVIHISKIVACEILNFHQWN